MADFVRVPETDWQNILDATREKTGGTEKMLSGEVATAIAGIEAGGGGDTTEEDGLVARTLTEYVNNRVTQVGSQVFRDYKTLTSVTMEKCTKIEADAFNGCTNLSSVYFPNVTYLATRAFASSGLTEVTEENLPKLNVLIQCFNNCASLKKIVIPSVETVSNSQTGCTSLEYAEYANAKAINASSFNGCSVFDTLVLRKNALATLANINAFTGTPFASGGTGGTVYVPQALISQYQQATNWSTLYAAGTCNFVAIEGSEYE